MKQLLEHNYLVRKNILTIIGMGLCFYFSYHLVAGQRSYVRYLTLQQNIHVLENQSLELHEEREALEARVAMLRPTSINKDLLEERARLVLGFRQKDEKDILFSK
ncbi:MAG: septum formation initiator family protein [Alphaproteobacteria bacterium]|nr:septum formation initiator family protein [Alphaproteobacteria bacterium]MCB1551743.1 septum formation initiator family protein [Alphaproteobacteria bacterium]MCB9984855.1 septum formation initiator family protein [Micavibrio sp.]HPQ50222.1 septum formation initiator family protein [Alphaproteobacteria bacterium]HRK97247.1 septum formation initiator family protein [Alphaproteobacteria bacterium]